ncbi:Putative phosphonopyruvate decarboxylase or sulfopyruvate decarboxylase, beta subunit [Magnetospirillum sp. XM-1]|uniref:thiamine pyrophosphate-dependent enzyme n=1 Tax=Magnetospirillum sp. XM-1 TaxID=1663591 RepID=UPI00073DC14C|nr:thiamine pyrophosphate-dependent enzyme [Magnetospirillum sp. XM-1]CUW38020.1 Putative phosphonopyruvate decarboxylase or sulfopyruvate decarboxylase, beta subunit [Magnetospirillum sp. XM-1]
MMTRAQAVAAVAEAFADHAVIGANGMISRELFTAHETPLNFYMVGSMGLAGAIGLGVAEGRPEAKVLVLDGDGNVLMHMGLLAMVGERRPANFTHVVLDNEVYGSTGDQRSISDRVDLAAMAAAAGYATVLRAGDREGLDRAVATLCGGAPRPAFLLVKVTKDETHGIGRVTLTPEQMFERLRINLASTFDNVR